ncbi:hypothetical protein EX895_000638 [Sporisorium graminicola]|uniref:Small nuclear ribonucleoprotein Prp3 C-terminal domain-containing protein n=1 Tax=Sporisorium graminicola TaxID=280036 RepID=A0A4U7L1G4_9BASI|nr:hypothetical protein EX895_000638 [Sporisorium graminicola]TKY90640.1 hypothetical protein EX895_000638 [Sporisorium graminicola]
MAPSSYSSAAATALLTLRYASLEDVAQDLDMVIQSSSQGEWSWEGASEEESRKWIDFIQDPVSVPESDTAGLAGKLNVVDGVSLMFCLLSHPHGQEAEGGREAVVDVSAPTLATNDVTRIKKAVLDRSHQWRTDGVESLFLFDLVTTAQTLAADLTASSESTLDAPHTSPDTRTTDAHPAHIELARALFWSHHLKAPSKLKDFNNWCPELSIWGVVRVGYPGYLCFEGEAEAVEEMVKRVKGLQWHAIQLRVDKRWTWMSDERKQGAREGRSAREQALLSCALAQEHPDNVFVGQGAEAKVRTGCQVIETLGDLVTRLRRCRLSEEEIEEALGIRMSNSNSNSNQ